MFVLPVVPVVVVGAVVLLPVVAVVVDVGAADVDNVVLLGVVVFVTPVSVVVVRAVSAETTLKMSGKNRTAEEEP